MKTNIILACVLSAWAFYSTNDFQQTINAFFVSLGVYSLLDMIGGRK